MKARSTPVYLGELQASLDELATLLGALVVLERGVVAVLDQRVGDQPRQERRRSWVVKNVGVGGDLRHYGGTGRQQVRVGSLAGSGAMKDEGEGRLTTSPTALLYWGGEAGNGRRPAT